MEEDLRYVPPKKYTEEEKKALLASWESERVHPIWKWGDYAYSWFGNGMLKSVKLPDSSLVTFEYDALGRRTAKVGGKQINRYFWDGNVLLHEWKYDKSERPAAAADELGALKVKNQEPAPDVVTWVYEDGSYVPSAKLVNEQRYSIVSDYLGRPVQAYSDRGQLVWQTDYDIYGGLRNLEGEREFIPFRQLGQYEDGETGLYYNRFRYYDSSIGSYICQDPIGLVGANSTLYAFVIDVNSEIDEFGLFFGKVIGSAQSTHTFGHAAISRIYAEIYSLNPKVQRVTLDLGYKKILGSGNFKWGPRPDVGVLYKNGSVKVIEVASKSDIIDDLIGRNTSFMKKNNIDDVVKVSKLARLMDKIKSKFTFNIKCK